MSNFKG